VSENTVHINLPTSWSPSNVPFGSSQEHSQTACAADSRQLCAVAYPGIFFEGVQQIEFRIEGREIGDLGAVAPQSGVPLNLQVNESHILIRLLWMYIPRHREFG
jgi:hypothetical protein